MATLLGQLKIYKYKFERNNVADFASLVTQQGLTDDELMVHCNQIETQTTDIKTRSSDLFELKKHDWMFDPFMDMKHVNEQYQNKLIGL